MPISYNAWVTPSHCYRLTGASSPYESGSFSGNLAGTTGFQYFLATAAVGNCFYFGNSPRFDDIRVNINTPLVAVSVSGSWEYYNGSSWATLTVTDPSGGFTVTGTHTIAFVPPDDWRGRAINSQTKMWVRYRITAISTPSQAASNNGVDKVGDNKWIVTGYTEASPCTYDALVSANPNEALKMGNMYYLRGRLEIGDGSMTSWFIDKSKAIEFPQFAPAWISVNAVDVKNSATFRMGQVIDATNKLGENGCTFITKTENGCYCNLSCATGGTSEYFGCAFMPISPTYVMAVTATKMWQCLGMYQASIASPPSTAGNFRRVTLCRGRNYPVNPASGSALSDFEIYETAPLSNNALTVSNVKAYLGNSTASMWQMSTWVNEVNLINSTVKKLNGSNFYELYWNKNSGALFNRKYSLSIRVSDQEGNPLAGAEVTVRNNLGVEVSGSPFTTDANGEAAIGNLLHEKREPNTGYTPPHYQSIVTTYTYTVTIVKAGYQTYTDVLTVDREMELEIALGQPAPPVYIPVPSAAFTIEVAPLVGLEVSLNSPKIEVTLND